MQHNLQISEQASAAYVQALRYNRPVSALWINGSGNFTWRNGGWVLMSGKPNPTAQELGND